MPNVDVRSKLEASASVLLGNTRLNATGSRPSGPNSPGWARRVLANLEAHVATGVALSEESQQALAAHQAAMRRLQVGDRVSMDGEGRIVPAGTLGEAMGVISRIGEDGQVEVTRLPATTSGPTGPTRNPWYTGPTSANDLQRFVNEYMNEPPPPSPNRPNPATPGGQARLNREQAFARNRPAPTSEMPATTPPMSRTDEDRLREAQQAALLQLLEARRRAVTEAANSPPSPPPNPLQHAEVVVEGRPKRRVLRKKKSNE